MQTLLKKIIREIRKEEKYWCRPQNREMTKCPICKTSGKHYIVSHRIHYEICPKCSTIFQNPRITQKAMFEWIMTSKAENMWIDYLETECRERDLEKYEKFFEMIPRITYVQSYLDIGCSSGLSLDAALSYFQPLFNSFQGVEIQKKGISIARKKGFKIYEKLPDKKYNVISVFEVLEHWHDLKALFSYVSKHLISDGYFLVFTPNPEALIIRIMGRDSFVWGGHHIHIIPRSTLISYAQKFGLSLYESGTLYPKSKELLQYLYPEKNIPVNSELLDNVIGINLWGYKYLVIFRKV